jgi:transposase
VKREVHFEQPAQEAALLDYLGEVERTDRAARPGHRPGGDVGAGRDEAVIEALQSLRGIAKVSAVTIACEVGDFSRFAGRRRLRIDQEQPPVTKRPLLPLR